MTPSAKLKQLWDARIAVIERERDEARQRLAAAEALLLSDTITEPCGHAHKWLAHRDPIDPASPTYCTFCEIARLRGLLREAVTRCDSTSSIRRYDGLRLGEDWFKRVILELEVTP